MADVQRLLNQENRVITEPRQKVSNWATGSVQARRSAPREIENKTPHYKRAYVGSHTADLAPRPVPTLENGCKRVRTPCEDSISSRRELARRVMRVQRQVEILAGAAGPRAGRTHRSPRTHAKPPPRSGPWPRGVPKGRGTTTPTFFGAV
ncbi:hypothetical protein GWK47_000981 [Chionoecetes opilio]|uniref:Uncharacterized protein n=1 Tax=Chionoecetes opilio TaxID=41210 RepID=A0A8J5CQX4_CHIOP|nr:hypothetical protein GWK47_000981 [Chionoecetes opilio]